MGLTIQTADITDFYKRWYIKNISWKKG